jgi:putative ATP-dependent endonuclease of OLD family
METQQSIKITKLIIKNYRGIGSKGLEIDIDDVVVLVGPNNSGKSTILKAFQLVTASSDTKIKIDDFYNKSETNKPEIEVWSKVIDASKVTIDKDKWIGVDGIVKERWLWERPDEVAVRYGFRIDLDGGRWAIDTDTPKAPFSNDGGATAYRPSPTYISPFEQPEKQVEEIKKIIALDIYDLIKKAKKDDPKYTKLVEDISKLQEEIKSEASEKENELATGIGSVLSELFSGTTISLHVPQSSPDILSSYAGVKDIDFKINDLALENQGSGMQRMLLWSVLKMLAGRKKTETKPKKTTKKKVDTKATTEDLSDVQMERSKVLLMDEPEICLHPESVRQAKEILYSLASGNEWQVMITTHSPVFIDLSKNNTNIIRVQKDEEEVNLFKTNDAALSNEEKEQIKMLNVFDPYFAEFFFSKTTIVVEGDTEYTAFRKIIEKNRSKYKDIHIIRARGKYTILPIIKILKKWGKNFSVLHDSDEESNPQSWPANKQILELIDKDAKIKLLATKKNFEAAFFTEEVSKDKPYNAYTKVDDTGIADKVGKLLDYLCGLDQEISVDINDCVCEYKTIDELKGFLNPSIESLALDEPEVESIAK